MVERSGMNEPVWVSSWLNLHLRINLVGIESDTATDTGTSSGIESDTGRDIGCDTGIRNDTASVTSQLV